MKGMIAELLTARLHPHMVDRCGCGRMKCRAAKKCRECERHVRTLTGWSRQESVRMARETRDRMAECGWLEAR